MCRTTYDANPRKPGYLDEVTLSKRENVMEERIPPSHRNTGFRIENVLVNKTENVVDIEFNPYSCQSKEETFDLLGIAGAKIEEMESTLTGFEYENEKSEYLRNNKKATFIVGGGKIIVERLQKESSKMIGTFSLTLGNKTVDKIPRDTPFYQLQEIIENNFNLFGVQCDNLWWDQCYRLHQSFEYKYIGGYQPEIKFNGSNLNSEAERLHQGSYLARNGGVFINQLGGDFFRLIKTTETKVITVWVKSFLSSCEADSCTFDFDSNINPSMDSVSSQFKDNFIHLTIFGSGFTSNVEDYSVNVGDRTCVVHTATSVSITCQLENGPAGALQIELFVKSRAKATGSLSYTLDLLVDSLTPETGGTGGGTKLTIKGAGFPNDKNGWGEDGGVYIGGEKCTIKESSYTHIICLSPPELKEARKKRDLAELSVRLNGNTVSGGNFKYDLSLSPTVSKLSPLNPKVKGGEILTISGDALGYKGISSKVKIGTMDCPVINWTNTEITCTLPPLENGKHKVIVEVNNNGFADVSEVEEIEVFFKVTGVSPSVGSKMGGSIITIHGIGFGNCSEVTFSLGSRYMCNPIECSDTQVLCKIENHYSHQIRNTGNHFKFGPGYKWEPATLDIIPGDTVQWSWNMPVAQEGTGISVHSVNSSIYNEFDGKGFSSGSKRAKGFHTHTFFTEGTFLFNTEDVLIDEEIFMPGKVVAKIGGDDEIVQLNAKIGDITAFSDPNEIIAGTSSQGECPLASTSCTSEPTNEGKVMFKFAACLAPVITDIAIVKDKLESMYGNLVGGSTSEIEISGNGFGTEACQNTVTVGDGKCDITYNSDTLIKCSLVPQTIKSLKHFPVIVNVQNKGSSVQQLNEDTDGKLLVLPTITEISPKTGSWAGGNVVKITGTGLKSFDEIIFIDFGEPPYQMGCRVVEVLENVISCIAPDMTSQKSADEKSISVTVYIGAEMNEPLNPNNIILDYTYSSSKTPTVTSVVPEEYTSSQGVQIIGTGFKGDDVKVFVKSTKVQNVRTRRSIIELKDEANKGKMATLFGPKPELIHTFWKRIKEELPSKSLKWKQPGTGISKRSLNVPTIEESDILEEEEFHPLVDHIHKNTVIDFKLHELDPDLYQTLMKNNESGLHHLRRRSVYHRKKRSTVEEILEMAMTDYTECVITSSSETAIEFTVPALPAGQYNIMIIVGNLGFAINTKTISSTASISSIDPSSGSIHGGQIITINGNGFSGSIEDTEVKIGDQSCLVHNVTLDQIKCETGGGEGAQDLTVTSANIEFQKDSFKYEESSTPKISSIAPENGETPTSLQVNGQNFGTKPEVTIGIFTCTVTESTSDTIKCDVGAIPGGNVPVRLRAEEYGYSNNMIFKAELLLTKVQPLSGSMGGGTRLTLSGVAFDPEMANIQVLICGTPSKIIKSSHNEITLQTPLNNGTGQVSCNVELKQKYEGTALLENGFKYDEALTPKLTSVSPRRGGTGGGTPITLTGSGFATSGNKVLIDGVNCNITAESETEIKCLTNSHDGCIEVEVIVDVPTKGYAQQPDDDKATLFYYIDRWNSIYTWGGTGLPQVGELIHITVGQTILLDTSTPTVKMVLIDGGHLIFDRDANGLNLNAEFILILKGGSLQIGTEDQPYENEAQITLHGNVRCTELPIYGCKTIGVRDGNLELHGNFIPMTWTHLAETANAGEDFIILDHGVNWKVGSEIVVATTGGRASMGESEKMVIKFVSEDGKKLTLTEPLKFKHLSLIQTFGDNTIETKAEVGLLTRNVKVKGSVNQQFVTEIPACEKPFVANEEATQSCFQGKFGEETGSDEFGAVILIHAKEKDKHLAMARISYSEFNIVGQAFRVGRYPIHFHINGNVSGSYVRGNAIHKSFNRACTIHAVSNLLVEHNVVYNAKGLSFFVEDGVEEDNILQYNLAVFTRQSNSLLNPDIQPGSFWIVNPNNIVRHNAVAGSTHFGFWYRVLKYPDGPSRTTSYCPSKAPMGQFYNNSAHSNGLYGIWIFTAGEKGWHPHTGTKENGYCDGHPTTATFGSFTAWNNEIGVELVEGGALRFENMTLLDNEKSGIEIILAVGTNRQNGDDYGGSHFKNSVVIGHSKITEDWVNGDTFCTKTGVYSGWYGNNIEDVEFYNFDRPICAAMTNCARCKPKWSSHKVQTKGLSFTNSPNKVSWTWTMDGFYEDLDGSLCGKPNCKVIQKRDIYDPAHCSDDIDDEFSHVVGNRITSWLGLGLLPDEPLKLEGYVCDETQKFHIVGFNNYAPSSLQYNDVVFHNKFGSSRVPWRKKPPHKDGWAAILPEGPVNYFFWNTMDHITNISYRLTAYQFAEKDDYLLLGHNFTQVPDVFTFNGEMANTSVAIPEPLTSENSGNTNWFFDTENKELSYKLSNKGKVSTRKKRAGSPREFKRDITFRVYRCLYEGCLAPAPPTVPTGRPADFKKWSNALHWADMEQSTPIPGANGVVENIVTIPPGVWMVLDIMPPPLTRLYIYGVLEISEDINNITLSAEIILIQGDAAKLVAGTEEKPFTNNFNLVLRGNHETEDQPLPNGPNLGAKALGVFGKLEMAGLDVGKTWSRLSSTAEAGSSEIILTDTVNPSFWKAGAEIVITPTSYEPTEVEKKIIKSIEGQKITLDSPLKFKHQGEDFSLPDGSETWTIAAEVGLLSRNIKIIGEDYQENVKEEFGARVLVSKFTQTGTEYKGYAKLSNVEFIRAGQEGWTDREDPRYSLAFLNHGESMENDEAGRTSFVKKCAFNFNYNAAIGLFNSDNIALKDNVVYRTLEYGIVDEGMNNQWIGNLIVWTKFVGAHKDQRQNSNKRGCVNMNEAWDAEFKDNSISGCERAGIATTGHICSSSKKWSGNVIHSSQEGIHVNTYYPPLEIREDKVCVVFRNFLVYKIYDYAFYLLTHDTVELENNIVVDSGVGVHPFLIRPRPTTHNVEEKYLQINNTLFVGRSDNFDCNNQKEPSYLWFDKERNKGGSMWPGRNWKGSNTGHAGILWPIFSGIGVPLGKPWINGKPKSFPLLTGQAFLNSVTFYNFKSGQCNGEFDSAIRTNPRGDDMQFPIISKDIKFINVEENSKIWMDRPLMKLVVNEHCVDMHCDGLKKALLIDTDGSVIGNDKPGTIISDSSYEWEKDPSAGLGYYRIPLTMVTEVNGDKIEYEDKMPKLGIVRNDQCVWMESWNAFKCHDINHRLLIMESMDIDTLDRRLSPVAVLANPGPSGYIDLINGPQDWSCCFGYACQKRISNFYSIVGTNMMYEIHLTSTPPIHMRYRLKHNEGGDAILLKLYFPKPQRIDVFVGERYVAPQNIDLSSEKYKLSESSDDYIPKLTSELEGANYFDPTTGFLYILMRGTSTIDYKIKPAVVSKLGLAIDIENFFEGDAVANSIADLLGIDQKNIRVTNIVREGRRKRRGTTENVELEFEIIDDDYEKLKNLDSELKNKFQTGALQKDLKLNVTSMSVIPPIEVPSKENILCPDSFPQDEDPNAPCYFGPEENSLEGVSWSEASQLNATKKLEKLVETSLAVPTELKIKTEPGQANEMALFKVQPALVILDSNGKEISELGSDVDPWAVKATIVEGSGALVNDSTCKFMAGLCTFDNIAIDKMGNGYQIKFDLINPPEASLPDVKSKVFPVGPRPITIKFTSLPSLQPVNQTFEVKLAIWDDALNILATPELAPSTVVECELVLEGTVGVKVEGNTQVKMIGKSLQE